MNDRRRQYDLPKRIVDTNGQYIRQLEEYTSKLPNIPNNEVLKPRIELNLTALKTSVKGNRFDNGEQVRFENCIVIPNQIEEVLKTNRETDLLTTGEHTLFFHPNIAEAMKFDQDENGKVYCVSGQKEVMDAIVRIQNIARRYKANICLGTVCEQEEVSSNDGDIYLIHHNTAIVIDSNGDIVQVRRKTTGSESATETTEQGCMVYEQAKESALRTISPIELTNQKGEKFRALVCVCAERSDVQFYERAATADADVLVLMVDEGDDHYTERSRSKYENGYVSSNAYINQKWSGDVFFDIARKLRVLNSNGVVLAADSVEGGQAGIFVNTQDGIKDIDFDDKCVKAKCFV